ncbi:transcriptional regulator [Asanoa ferruginea]|uniref:Transcriptional regulator n=1 Tax=Asanoa ferruginea TaxID=53367 RepID=A0A3D9ZV13_9ACTN|nr:transcriptional regulator [Asanoa ferruginea]
MVADRPVDLGTPKQRTLLTLLVARVGQPVTVETMQDVLWAGSPPRSAIASLHAYIANLRRVLEPARAPRTPATVLCHGPLGYLLDRLAVDLDVHRFGEYVAAGWRAWDRGDPRQALTEFESGLTLWRGKPYAETADAPCVAPEVARLEELRLSTIEARAGALLAVGARQAVAELEGFVHAHPLRERGSELLSLALYRDGRQAEALGVLRNVQRRLATELGIDAGPSLRRLEREILNQDTTLDWHPATGVPTSRMVSGTELLTGNRTGPTADGEVFVGREEALQRLNGALDATVAGRGRVIAVSGEPGIGKTTLLRRFADQAEAQVVWGSCPEHVDAPPLWLWEQVLRAVAARFPQHRVPRSVTDVLSGHTQPTTVDADAAGATLRPFEEIVDYLARATQSAPLVVVLDHAHRADPGSLQLLAHLAASVPTTRILLAVSYQSGEAASLAEAMAALARTGMTRIDLAGLNAYETRTLATAILQRDVTMSAAEALRARTDGNPFFLAELIKSLSHEPDLDQPHAAPMPVQVRDVVLRHVSQLPTAAAEVLSVAAAVGQHFDIEVVAEAASIEIEAALEALDVAVAASLIAEDTTQLGWFRFTQPLVAEALYETTGRLRRARLHRRIGTAAARAWTGATDKAAEIARHWLLAAELDPTAAALASQHAAAAARVADARLAFDDATEWWRQALTSAELAGEEKLDRYSLLIGLGTSLCRAGDACDGLSSFAQAMEECLASQGSGGQPEPGSRITTAVAALSEFSSHVAGCDELGDRLVHVLERGLLHIADPVHRSLALSCLAAARRRDDGLNLRAAALDGADYFKPRVYAAT